ncbi:UNVERIFIED_CONTAM: hypothetical protein K2H54_055209 [Gekko kuhli]
MTISAQHVVVNAIGVIDASYSHREFQENSEALDPRWWSLCGLPTMTMLWSIWWTSWYRDGTQHGHALVRLAAAVATWAGAPQRLDGSIQEHYKVSARVVISCEIVSIGPNLSIPPENWSRKQEGTGSARPDICGSGQGGRGG